MTSRLKQLLRQLPEDTDAAVAALGSFRWEKKPPRTAEKGTPDWYFEVENEPTPPNTLAELRENRGVLVRREVVDRFLDEYGTPESPKQMKFIEPKQQGL